MSSEHTEFRSALDLRGVLPMEPRTSIAVTTPTETEIVMTRPFDAPRTLVFAALTKPEQLKCWFAPLPTWSLETCEVDLRKGGAYRFDWRGPGGTSVSLRGVYRTVVVPQLLVADEEFDAAWLPGRAFVTKMLSARRGTTALIVTYRYASRKIRDAVLRSPMTEGMTLSYDTLEKNILIASGRREL